jgi:hypothetical protein
MLFGAFMDLLLEEQGPFKSFLQEKDLKGPCSSYPSNQ